MSYLVCKRLGQRLANGAECKTLAIRISIRSSQARVQARPFDLSKAEWKRGEKGSSIMREFGRQSNQIAACEQFYLQQA